MGAENSDNKTEANEAAARMQLEALQSKIPKENGSITGRQQSSQKHAQSETLHGHILKLGCDKRGAKQSSRKDATWKVAELRGANKSAESMKPGTLSSLRKKIAQTLGAIKAAASMQN